MKIQKLKTTNRYKFHGIHIDYEKKYRMRQKKSDGHRILEIIFFNTAIFIAI